MSTALILKELEVRKNEILEYTRGMIDMKSRAFLWGLGIISFSSILSIAIYSNSISEVKPKYDSIINSFEKTVNKFIKWIVKKFDIAEEDNLIRDFEKETHTFIDPEKQIKKEEREKEWDSEI